MNTFAFVTRKDEHSAALAEQIRQRLTAAGYTETDSPETVFVIGGDGTFLYAVHQYLEQLEHVTFYGLHTGTLGFCTDYRESDLEEFLQVFLDGKTEEVRLPLLESISASGRTYAVNEIRIENAARTQVMEIYINGEKFETYRGTGMCVCTQLGSTAYNRSLRGAVLAEGLPVIELCEISGIHHSRYRSLGSPLVLKNTAEIEFRAESFRGALLGSDNDVLSMDDIQRVTVRMSPGRSVRVRRGRRISYFERLKTLF